MPDFRPLHVYGLIRFYPDLRDENQNAWENDFGILAGYVLQHANTDEEAFGYQIAVTPSPEMSSYRWATCYNTETQCLICHETLYEAGSPYTNDELSDMARSAKEFGMNKLLELIHTNHPEMIESKSRPEFIDYYGIGRALV